MKRGKSSIDKLIGQYCKVVTKEPGQVKSTVIFGTIKEIDHEQGFLMIKSEKGLGCLNIRTIRAIKPRINNVM